MASSAQRWEIVGEKVGSYRNERECRARECFWGLRTASASCFAALRWFASRVRVRQGGWYAYAGSMLGGSAWWVVDWYGIALLQDALGGVEEGEAAQRRIRSTSKRDRHRTGSTVSRQGRQTLESGACATVRRRSLTRSLHLACETARTSACRRPASQLNSATEKCCSLIYIPYIHTTLSERRFSFPAHHLTLPPHTRETHLYT